MSPTSKFTKMSDPTAMVFYILNSPPTIRKSHSSTEIEIVPGTPGRLLPIRLLARPNAYTDSNKAEWLPDQLYTGGQFVQRHEKISGTLDQELYQASASGILHIQSPSLTVQLTRPRCTFVSIGLEAGDQEGGGVGSRVFDVYMNGRTLLEHFDISQESGGPLRPIRKTFRNLHPNAQGKLVFQFVPVRNHSLINAIEVLEEN